jgi:hypothetical protein
MTNPLALTLLRLFLLTLRQHYLLKPRLTFLLLHFARNQYLFACSTRNCQRNVNSDFNRSKRDLKISQRNDVKSDLKIDRNVSLPRNQGAFLNPRPAGTATRTSAAGMPCFVT